MAYGEAARALEILFDRRAIPEAYRVVLRLDEVEGIGKGIDHR
jgi:hypothetical protein